MASRKISCEGIRVFNAYTYNNTQTFVFVAVDTRNNNIREYKQGDGEIVKAPIADGGLPCPQLCPNLDSDMPSPGWEDYITMD